jgi:hypothetical protein
MAAIVWLELLLTVGGVIALVLLLGFGSLWLWNR